VAHRLQHRAAALCARAADARSLRSGHARTAFENGRTLIIRVADLGAGQLHSGAQRTPRGPATSARQVHPHIRRDNHARSSQAAAAFDSKGRRTGDVRLLERRFCRGAAPDKSNPRAWCGAQRSWLSSCSELRDNRVVRRVSRPKWHAILGAPLRCRNQTVAARRGGRPLAGADF
jgi:hypothetical protein